MPHLGLVDNSFKICKEEERDLPPDDALVGGDHIAAYFGADIRVWTLSGELVYSLDAPDERRNFVQAMAFGQQKLYSMRSNSISCLDLATGAVQHECVTLGRETTSSPLLVDLFVCDTVLLVLLANLQDRDRVTRLNPDAHHGFYVIDTNDFSQKHFFPGHYDSCVQASDEPGTVVAISGRRHISVFQLKDGVLSRRVEFSLPHRSSLVFMLVTS